MISVADLGLGTGFGCLVGIALGSYLKGMYGEVGKIDAAISRLEDVGKKAFREAFESEAGKRMASHQDIDNILSEVRNVTRETESIKAQINGDAWLSQTIWMEKRKMYGELLKAVGGVHYVGYDLAKLVLRNRRAQANNTGNILLDQGPVDHLRNELVGRFKILGDCFAEAELFDPSLVKMRARLTGIKNLTKMEKAELDVKQYKEIFRSIIHFRRQLVNHMRKEIGINDAIVDQSEIVPESTTRQTISEASAQGC